MGVHVTATAELADLDRRISELRKFEQDYRARLRLFHQQQLNDLDSESGTVTVPRLPADQRKHLIEWLASEFMAQRAERWPPGTTAHLLALWGSGALRGAALDRAFADYLDAERLRRDVADGRVPWQDVLPGLDCAEPEEEARKATRYLAARALAVLVHGDPSAASLPEWGTDPQTSGSTPASSAS
jgi:hypothetical protein